VPSSTPGFTRFEEQVTESFTEQLARSKHFELAEDIGPNTLILRGHVVDGVRCTHYN
jgi:hypothetical protein